MDLTQRLDRAPARGALFRFQQVTGPGWAGLFVPIRGEDAVEKKKIDGKRFVADFRAGMHKNQLMMTHELSPSQLDKLLDQLVKAGILRSAEVDTFRGVQRADKDLPAGPLTSSDRAPAVGTVARNPHRVPDRTRPSVPTPEDLWWRSQDQAKARGFWGRLKELGHLWVEETKRRSKFRLALGLVAFVFTGDFHYIDEFNLKFVLFYCGVLGALLGLLVGYLQWFRSERMDQIGVLETVPHNIRIANCEVCEVLWLSRSKPGEWSEIREGLQSARAMYPKARFEYGPKMGPQGSLERLTAALDKLVADSADKEALEDFRFVQNWFWEKHCEFDYPKCKQSQGAPNY
jgi:hypothetical protein